VCQQPTAWPPIAALGYQGSSGVGLISKMNKKIRDALLRAPVCISPFIGSGGGAIWRRALKGRRARRDGSRLIGNRTIGGHLRSIIGCVPSKDH